MNVRCFERGCFESTPTLYSTNQIKLFVYSLVWKKRFVGKFFFSQIVGGGQGFEFFPASLPALCVCYQRKRRKMEQDLEQNLSRAELWNLTPLWRRKPQLGSFLTPTMLYQLCCKWLKHNIIIWRSSERHRHYSPCCVSIDCMALFQDQVMAACLTLETFSWLNIAVYIYTIERLWSHHRTARRRRRSSYNCWEEVHVHLV